MKKVIKTLIKKILKFFFPNIFYFGKNFFYNHKLTKKNLIKLYNWAIKEKYFDPEYYLKNYNLNFDTWEAFKFFIDFGYLQNHNPSKKFSTIIYYSLRPDVKKNNVNPLFHFYFFGKKEDPILIDKLSNLKIDHHGFETQEKEQKSFQPLKNSYNTYATPKIFAFFLPGFHEDKFNNSFWGKGFTEWDNLKNNFNPNFLGHKIPLSPQKFYNLLSDSEIEKQCKLAKSSGINGFYIFLYDFGVHGYPLYKIIPKLIRILSKNGLEFCFEWANEPWTRRWDGLDKEILINQSKKTNQYDINKFIKRISKFMKQDNYLSIDGKKYFSIYRPDYFEDIDISIQHLKVAFSQEKLEVHLSACKTFSIPHEMLENSNFDSITEYPPHPLDNNVNYHFDLLNNDKTNLWCYKKFLLYYINYVNNFKSNKRIFRTIFPSWDNTPRKGINSNTYINTSSSNFSKLLSTVISDELKRKNNDKVFFINSWNEWGEGANLEPDTTFGYWKLNCLNKIVLNYLKSYKHEKSNKLIFLNNNIKLVLIHIYNIDHFQFLYRLAKNYKQINFLITIPKFQFSFSFKPLNNVLIKTIHNEERDFNVIYQSKSLVNLEKYKVISKIHFKNRDQVKGYYINNKESQEMVENEIKINHSINDFNKNIFICRKHWVYKNHYGTIGSNRNNIDKVLYNLKVSFTDFYNEKFSTGGIWTIVDNNSIYKKFTQIINEDEFKLDNFWNPSDGLYIHALERVTLLFFLKYNFKLVYAEDLG